MDKLVYYLAYPWLWLVSSLPFPALYALSNLLYYLLYYVIGYRKKVVHNNLKMAFPQMSEAQRVQIARKFYRHLADIFMEVIKGLTLTPEELHRRVSVKNIEVFRELEKSHDQFFLLAPHYASWEWMLCLGNYLDHTGYAVYQPIGNVYFDRLIRKSRARLGTTLLSIHDTREIMKLNRKSGAKAIYGIVSDQSPTLHRPAYWGEFFGIRVPVHIGAEKLAKKWDMPVVYLKVNKPARGYYEAELILLTQEPRELPDFELSDMFMRSVEETVKQRPELYFWTHKRWKHRGKESPENSINYERNAEANS
jgi:KDO2-lipid IV(A) lauroyltransferase